MKRLFALLVLLGFCFSLKAQVAPDRYWVQFTDKNNTPYFIAALRNSKGRLITDLYRL